MPGELIVGFEPSVAGATEGESVISDAGLQIERPLLVPGYSLVRVPPGREREFAMLLRKQPHVRTVEFNTVLTLFFEPNDEFYEWQWHFPKIGLPAAWDKTMGTGATVAVLDSGVAYEDCAAVACGADYFRAPDFGGTTFVSPWDFVDNDAHANDRDGHGTHVASTIAEATANAFAGAGVAPGAAIMPVRVIGPGAGIAEASEGIVYAADNGADVINLSLGGPQVSSMQQDAVNYALSQGVVVVAATGNGGDDQIGDPVIFCPACYPGVIGVGATRIDQSLAFYSNYGASPPGTGHAVVLVAPGGELFEDRDLNGIFDRVYQQTFTHKCNPLAPIDFGSFAFCGEAGTSMASPHVAGVCRPRAVGQQCPNIIRRVGHLD